MKRLALIFLIFPFAAKSQIPSFEHAPTLGKGKMEVIGGYSIYRVYNYSRSYELSRAVGIQFGIGTSQNVDISARYERINDTYFYRDENYDYFDLRGKFAFDNKHFVFILPVGIYIGSNRLFEPDYAISPQLLGTIFLGPNIDLSLSCSYRIIMDGLDFVGGPINLNAGMAISSDITKWSVRPAFGYNFFPGSEEHTVSFNIGLQYRI